MDSLSLICSKCRRLLTFDLQVDVILINSEAVAGHAGVFTAVVSLSRVHLQSAVVMNDVRVSIQGAGAAVLKPESQRQLLEPFKVIQSTRSSVQGSFHSPGNFWDGRPEGGAVDQSALIFDDLVDFVGWSQHSGRLGCREATAIIAALILFRNQWKWKMAPWSKWVLRIELTEHVDEGVGQEVPVVVGDVTLVNGAGPSLHVSEDDGVILHLSAGVWRSICAISFK